MNLLNGLLLGACAAFPIVVCLRRFQKEGGVVLHHVVLFSAGYFSYLVLPIILAESSLFSLYSNYQSWYTFFLGVSEAQWTMYFLSCLGFYAAFWIGDILSRRVSLSRMPKGLYLSKRVLAGSFVFVLGFATFFVLQMKEHLFLGYTSGNTTLDVLGSLTAAVILLLTFAVFYCLKRKEESPNLSFLRTVLNPYVAVYLIFAGLLVSLGGRVIFFSAMMIFGVIYTQYFKRLSYAQVIFFLFAMLYGSHFILKFREGNLLHFFSSLDVYSVVLHLLSEIYNVAFSLLDFLSVYAIPIIKFPINLLSGFISLIPSVILPTKAEYVVTLNELGYMVYSPAGGANSFVTLVVNFGVLGSALFLGAWSFVLGCIQRIRSLPYSVIYVLCSGWVAFLFFRDLEQAWIKAIIEFSILAPLAIVLISSWVHRFEKK